MGSRCPLAWMAVSIGLLLALVALPGLPDASAAQVVVETVGYQPSTDGHAEFTRRIASLHSRNLLARDEARCVETPEGPLSNARLLTDGDAGDYSGEGRVMTSGRPTIVRYYLGEMKVVKEVGVFTCNGDTRSNQDFEVRFLDAHATPAQEPPSNAKPVLVLDSGEKVLGNDRGGLHTRFYRDDGSALLDAKADWIEFRLWPTHTARAGDPVKEAAPTERGATAYIELEVLGAEHDVVLPSPEELARRKAIRDAPKSPEYQKRSTWCETAMAGREAILRWETLQDRLALPELRVRFGPWHVLGPFRRGDAKLKELEGRKDEVDLNVRYETTEGEKLAWRELKDQEDGRVIELSESEAFGGNTSYFLCRSMTIGNEHEKRQLSLGLGATGGWLRPLPGERSSGLSSPAVPNRQQVSLPLSTGTRQLLARLDSRDGACRLWCMPQPNVSQPGARDVGQRMNQRTRLMLQLLEDFPAEENQAEIRREMVDEIWGRADRRHGLDDWLPGESDKVFGQRYLAASRRRLDRIREKTDTELGVTAIATEPYREQLAAWRERIEGASRGKSDARSLRSLYQRTAIMQEALDTCCQVVSLRLAVEDQRKAFADRYPKGKEYLSRIDQLDRRARGAIEGLLGEQATAELDASKLEASPAFLRAVKEASTVNEQVALAAREILLANPVLDFEKLLVVRGSTGFASNWTGPNRLGQELVILSPVRPDGEQTVIHTAAISSLDLHWDGQRILFSDGRVLWEIGVDGSNLRRVSPEEPPVTRYDGCYLPSGRILCASNSCEQAVPCTGGPDVGNLHLMDADGQNERRVTFDQDHNWNPTVMNNGRVVYTRWEYTDLPHYFSRLLFSMNPDGTGQTEYYGSGSYWPNAMYWPRPIPGHPTMISCVVSGHHGVSRVGEMLLLDPAKGRHEADGAVRKIPGYGKPVEPIIRDNLVGSVWPKFAAPYPLAEETTHRGAGKYFLACVQNNQQSRWDLCLVDVFDNITPILTGGFMNPVPLRPRPMPPVIPERIEPRKREAVVYLADVYTGPGLMGFPRGSIRQLRVGSHHYRYPGNGDTSASSMQGGWDIKKILGTVPVSPDGSAAFRVPANTPIFLQPLDEEGKAQQLMRSWFVAMPGEVVSCVGCHEGQNDGPAARYTLTANRRPVSIQPWEGPTRGFSFDREVQPVLDRRCVGCHNGEPCRASDGQSVTTIDLRAKRLHEGFTGNYSPAYLAMQQFVRRAGFESDNNMHEPAEFEADTSALVQLLKKGHYNVQLDRVEWEALYTWIDFNVPYPMTWGESHRPPKEELVELRTTYKKLFANVDDADEQVVPLPAIASFVRPKPLKPRPAPPTRPANWPMTVEEAQALQLAVVGEDEQPTNPLEREVDLGEGVTMKFRLIPAGTFVMGDPEGFDDECQARVVTIDRPFYLAMHEVTNAQFARFDAAHDSRYVDGRGKDRSNRGYPINGPDLPVVRIRWTQAAAYCQWLSEKTGLESSLPTEAEWEWACRAGTATRWSFGDHSPGMNNVANIADSSVHGWNHGRSEPGYQDGVAYTGTGGRYPANAWGLFDMHGNVAEWCATSYRPQPYDEADGRNAGNLSEAKVVRGGSWCDTMRFATSASRWRYAPYKPVYNVGFRPRMELQP